MDVPEAVRRLALYPFHELPVPPDVEHVELDGAFIAINPWPTAQVVECMIAGLRTSRQRSRPRAWFPGSGQDDRGVVGSPRSG